MGARRPLPIWAHPARSEELLCGEPAAGNLVDRDHRHSGEAASSNRPVLRTLTKHSPTIRIVSPT